VLFAFAATSFAQKETFDRYLHQMKTVCNLWGELQFTATLYGCLQSLWE